MFVIVPPAIPVQGAEPLTLAALIAWLVDSDDRFNKTGPGIRAGARILADAERGQAAGVIEIGKDDLPLLQAAAEKPTANGQEIGFPVRPARLLAPFLDAIAGATAERPVSGEP